ncbi:MAG: nucleotidyl transferase AbiEii/AbiGii toxin family protein [Chloroflexi bacterium]|nr:nucleotidyl transferase AbiEii/AbiGii toxin family protein [Chloroflexota bacterium]
MTTNVPASIRARLRIRAQAEGADFQLFLVRYACERFLYRLGASSVRELCVLKGASLLVLWMEEPYRATRDIDLLATGANDQHTVRQIVETICEYPCPEDGIKFDLRNLRVSSTGDNREYGGQSARFDAVLDSARISVHVDFGFGDAVIPDPIEEHLPTLLDGVPSPVLQTYPKETTIAEKFEAMVRLGTINSRMKDFYDVWALSEEFSFEGPLLLEAIAGCFERRNTQWTEEMPDSLTSTFYSDPDRRDLWNAYGRRGEILSPPPSAFEEIGERIQSFLGPVRDSILAGEPFDMKWSPGGPWRLPANGPWEEN